MKPAPSGTTLGITSSWTRSQIGGTSRFVLTVGAVFVWLYPARWMLRSYRAGTTDPLDYNHELRRWASQHRLRLTEAIPAATYFHSPCSRCVTGIATRGIYSGIMPDYIYCDSVPATFLCPKLLLWVAPVPDMRRSRVRMALGYTHQSDTGRIHLLGDIPVLSNSLERGYGMIAGVVLSDMQR
jgi:hypothetical protein